jgi:hypothetical protein
MESAIRNQISISHQNGSVRKLRMRVQPRGTPQKQHALNTQNRISAEDAAKRIVQHFGPFLATLAD